MTRDESIHGPVLRDASAQPALIALFATALLATGACANATVVGDGQGGNGGGKGATGGGGAKGGAGGIIVIFDAPVLPRDAGVDRPSGGTCGDGVIERSEQCDDGNTANGDGCSRLCQIEANWDCPTEGKPCKYVGNCGSGVLTSNKVCDDGNAVSGDGCSSDCKTIETGYICRVPGKSCATRCGDGIVKGFETCDDANTNGGDGCSATCKIEPGFDCTGSPSSCNPTVCGNGKKEAGETCDDGNTLPYDGCSSTCQSEPKCGTDTSAVGACKSTCGDGILWRGIEDCDDGNVADGDGCSHDCKIEAGWTCKSFFDDPPPKLQIPIIARDFMWFEQNGTGTGHPDFGHSGYCCDDSLQKGKGVVRSTLDPKEHKPVWAWTGGDTVPDPTQVGFTGKTAFDQWYRDVSGTNMTYYQSLTLLQNATAKTTYAMNSDTDQPWYDLCGFFPLDDLTKPMVDQNTGKVVTYPYDQSKPDDRLCHAYQGLGFGNSWAQHNYAFTTELRYWFQYQGTEQLKFTGDDDVWVFINGTLAVEMPGIHNRAVGTVILDASKGTAQVGYGDPPSSYTTVDLKMTIGSVYEVVVFQAERWCCGSNYMLTLANFIGGKSQCVPTCGDGVTVADEECDCGDGKVPVPAGCPGPNSDTTYGGCTSQCKWGAFCGDGTMQDPPNGPEECDLGKQNGNTSAGSKCSISCMAPRSCGDGKVDTDSGEECDLAGNNGLKLDSQLQPVSDPNDPAGQVFCTTDCMIPPGIVY
jgi:fibro-slime domain-containing protein